MIRLCVLITALPVIAVADPPVVQAVEIAGTRFSVTLSHADTGWDHYADGWEVRTPDGTVLGRRTLHHPHVTEQPFTRSMSIDVPDGVTRVFVYAKDNLGRLDHDGVSGRSELNPPPFAQPCGQHQPSRQQQIHPRR